MLCELVCTEKPHAVTSSTILQIEPEKTGLRMGYKKWNRSSKSAAGLCSIAWNTKSLEKSTEDINGNFNSWNI